MDIIYKKYSLFEDKTNFEIAPLTLLIGGNSSGKSTFLKGLSIMTSQSIWKDEKYDLGSIEFHMSNFTDPINLYYRTYSGLFREVSLKGMTISADEYAVEIEDANTLIRYVNENLETILEFKDNFSVLEKDEKGVSVKLNMKLYFDILIENELSNVVQYFKAHGFEEKIYSSTIADVKSRFRDKENFEKWFFQKLFVEFLESISEVKLNQTKELHDFKNEFFSPIFLNKENPIKILRLKEFGYPKRVFSASEDLFGKLLSNSYENRHISDLSYQGHLFQRKWIKSFFGETSEISVIPLNKLCSHFEVKLNGRYLTEQGMGVFKLLNLIYFLGDHYMDLESDLAVDRGKIKVEDLISEMLKLKKKRPVNQNRYLIIEEPETNLHPDFQVVLAEMLHEFALHSDWHLIVETHSEYLVRKLQVLSANQKEGHDLVRILNFGNKENTGKVKVIKIRKNGALSDSFFPGFYNVAHELQYQLLLSNGSFNN